MKHLPFLLLLACAANAYGQCDQFDNLLKKGDAYLKGKKPDYQEAINAYTAAILACSDRAGEAQKRLAKMVSDINKLKENALDAERKAIKAQEETKAALARSDSLYEVADAEKKRAEAVLDKIYFYNDRFGLAFDKNSWRFGFIDKQLNTKIAFQYQEAMPFDYTGYAKVKKEDNRYYLIDTTGKSFPLATEMNQLTPTVTALDLRSKNLWRIPDTVFLHRQLMILLLDNNQLDSLSEKIGKLTNLVTLHLSSNELMALPREIAQLKKLKSLNLSDNPLMALPPEIVQLRRLSELNQLYNQNLQITEFIEFFPYHPVELRKVDVVAVVTREIISDMLPPKIVQPPKRNSFDLRSHPLNVLLPKIAQIKSLQSNNFFHNPFSKLLPEVAKLESIQSLDLSFNRLSILPPDIVQLTNLRWLDLSHNQLNMMPSEIRSLKSLKKIYLNGNPFSPDYIEQLRKDMPWCEIKF